MAVRRSQPTGRWLGWGRRLSQGEKANRKRMATLACVHDADPAVRRPHDVIVPPCSRTGKRRPRARHTWLAGSVDLDPGQVIARAFAEAQARDTEHRHAWIVLVDGARRRITIHIVLDVVHVLERLWTTARRFYTAADPDAEDWVAARAARLLSSATDATVNTEATTTI